MLQMKPVPTREEQIRLLGLCGIEYRESHFVYQALDDGRPIGAAQFDIQGKHAVLDDIRQVAGTAEDREAMIILGRAVLNFLDLCGVETVGYTTSDPAQRRLALMIGFREKDGTLSVSLTGLFETHCRHEETPTP